MWYAYRSFTAVADTLRSRLTELLTPSMTNAELEEMSRYRLDCYCPYLRVHQIAMDRNE